MPLPGQATFNDLPREGVEGGEQRRCSVSLVVVRLARGNALPQRQDRRGSLKSLDAALFVNTQDDRIGRRIHVQPDHIPKLSNEVWISAELEVFDSMRLQIMCPPKPINCATAHAKATCHLISSPVRSIFRRNLHSRLNDLRRRGVAHFLGPTAASRILIDALQSPFLETPPDCYDMFSRNLASTRYLGVRNAGRRIQQNRCTTNGALRRGRLCEKRLQFTTNRRAHVQWRSRRKWHA